MPAAGAVTVGGHSVRGAELTFGLSVTGTVHPSELIANTGARPGDRLVLTKPLGTGFITTAAKKEQCPPETLAAAIASMTQLNAIGRDAARAAGGAHGLTDITGFGLLGHAAELADGSGVTLDLDSLALPAIEGARALATSAYYTKASKTNRAYVADRSRIAPEADPAGVELAFDAQTSGGLLISVDSACVDQLLDELRARGAAASAVIGRVREREGDFAVVLR
jgi:selenide,water dikinase